MAKQNVSSAPPYQESRDRGLVTQVVAKPVDALVSPGQDWELVGLMEGLKEFNPKLQRYLITEDNADQKEAKEAGQNQALTHKIDPENPEALPVMPLGVNPAFHTDFYKSARTVIGKRLGFQAANEMKGSHDEEKLTDEYDPSAKIPEWVSDHLSGISDPIIRASVAEQLITTSNKIMEEDRHISYNKAKEEAVGSSTAVIRELAKTHSSDPMAFAAALNANMDDIWGTLQPYQSRTELAESIVNIVSAQSEAMGGNPLLFDSLTMPDKSGLSMADRNPALAVAIAKHRTQAKNQYDKRIEEESQKINAERMIKIEADLEKGVPLSDQEILANTGKPGSLFRTTEAAVSFWKHQRQKVGDVQSIQYGIEAFRNGTAYLLKPEMQQKVADMATDPVVNRLHALMNDPDSLPQIAAGVKVLADLHTNSGSSVPNSALKRMMDGLSKLAPKADGQPDNRFLAAVEMYRAMPPGMRESYVQGDTQTLLDTYTFLVKDNQADKGAAYQRAYQGITPEAKEAAKKFVHSDEGRTVIGKAVKDAVSDVKSGLPLWDYAPFASPQNSDVMTVTASSFVQKYMMTNPGASRDQIRAATASHLATSFVYYGGTNMAIGVPEGVGQGGKEAITLAQQQLEAKYGKENKPTLVHMGNGNYTVMVAFNGGAPVPDGQMTWKDIQGKHSASFLVPEDFTVIKDLNTKAANNTLTMQDIDKASKTAAKLRMLGQDSKLPLGAINRVTDEHIRNTFTNNPSLTLGDSTNNPVPPPKNNVEAHKSVISHYTSSPRYSSPIGFSALVTATREGLVLKASPDPNSKAGSNIGFGYNFNSHTPEETKKHFDRAGIPRGDYEAIKAGTKSITADQARMLLETTLPEYRKMARDVVEQLYPRRFDNLPVHEQAVLTDIAYQAGRGGLAKFKTAIQTLFSGDPEAASKAFNVKYDKSGVMTPDTRGNRIRAAALSGGTNMMAYLRANGYLN